MYGWKQIPFRAVEMKTVNEDRWGN